MSLADVRLAMMESLASIVGVTVPEDPLPKKILDKSILVFPVAETSSLIGKGPTGGLAVQAPGSMQIEYHRRVSYEQLGSTVGDITSMIDTIRDLVWRELITGKFDGTVSNIRGVSLEHLGALGWNEWTFGARMNVAFTHLITVTQTS